MKVISLISTLFSIQSSGGQEGKTPQPITVEEILTELPGEYPPILKNRTSKKEE